MEVVGIPFDPGMLKLAMSRTVSVAQMVLILLLICGQQVYSFLGLPPPAFHGTLEAYKWQVGPGAWFVGNIVSSTLLNTGAFEIFYHEREVFSKMKQGRMPTKREILDTLSKLESDLDEEQEG
mmetsp:Transcript_10882/g.19933  ORF Transcript_10882/g.19933 Transcript_10882/m.19933 type:complete len:123 (+) Transcript_10882:262-630(+)|eukprot:CAMPEP_0197524236 /NCGR_PEP_ID=MMETSP1318-20131121/8961_1 /TAXON_ID=552666 /ORGANISM="Partenskyella glossopodia, Strain RCC365" /LENGTH=122 /DNA_ID=CAMNT_0043077141 /DNA_START=226 /DNA_END=594 /DNA_ORIENTATION=+